MWFKRKKPDGEVAGLLREIRDKLPSKEEQLFASVLSGAISKQGVLNSEGQPALSLAELAKQFTESMRSE